MGLNHQASLKEPHRSATIRSQADSKRYTRTSDILTTSYTLPDLEVHYYCLVKVEPMEKLIVLVVVIVLLTLFSAEGRTHPKLLEPKRGAETCSRDHEDKRNQIIEESQCGSPKDMFIELEPLAANLQVMPGAVWVKRCIGLCYESGSACVALETRTRQIPVRIYDAKTRRESCSWYPIEEHVRCGCCSPSVSDKCDSPKIYNPRKCSCQCPNNEERRNCLHKSKLNRNMKWNRSKCICEDRNK